MPSASTFETGDVSGTLGVGSFGWLGFVVLRGFGGARLRPAVSFNPFSFVHRLVVVAIA